MTIAPCIIYKNPHVWCTLAPERGDALDVPRARWGHALLLAGVGGATLEGSSYRVPPGFLARTTPAVDGHFAAFQGERITAHDARALSVAIGRAFERLATEALGDGERGLTNVNLTVPDPRLNWPGAGRGPFVGPVFERAFEDGRRSYQPYVELAAWLQDAGAVTVSSVVQAPYEYR